MMKNRKILKICRTFRHPNQVKEIILRYHLLFRKSRKNLKEERRNLKRIIRRQFQRIPREILANYGKTLKILAPLSLLIWTEMVKLKQSAPMAMSILILIVIKKLKTVAGLAKTKVSLFGISMAMARLITAPKCSVTIPCFKMVKMPLMVLKLLKILILTVMANLMQKMKLGTKSRYGAMPILMEL